ncbi:3-isopropylmalate dehydratase small subunit [Calidifontibacillus erzurumensis]|uniref:3-isopropylmalate dehydratase small subunit n=1 Tax=Calidifontibacillus erzurumensis TaxID=2741433 RepID=A0A8J8GIW6_9BACI|nr:3-isopropylmalate dehydratase small subunit [Calidifontibacillus erzurumensis]NSL53150.1 3-isopropylmalate dehydratase small subunit [Calidifontibacillus erzurumensis]
MKMIKKIIGKALPLGFSDVDTDQIAPSDAMKFSKRTNMADYIFRDWREDPNFVLNLPEFKDSTIFLAGENFGCGSSREHAPWALQDYGFEAIIAPSFGDIFKNNCSKVGLVTIELEDPIVKEFISIVKSNPQTNLEIDIEEKTVTCGEMKFHFQMDPFTQYRLMHGLNDIDITLLDQEAINEYEKNRFSFLPKIL